MLAHLPPLRTSFSAVPDEQRKIIKYNHVVANGLIFYNVPSLTRLLHQLSLEGHSFDDEPLARLSPYLTEHVNRFGSYTLDLNRSTPAPDYSLSLRVSGKDAQK